MLGTFIGQEDRRGNKRGGRRYRGAETREQGVLKATEGHTAEDVAPEKPQPVRAKEEPKKPTQFVMKDEDFPSL